MTKTFKFYTKNNSNNNSFHYTPITTDYSKTIDDLIFADVIDKNSYLFDGFDTSYEKSTTPIILTSSNLKFDDGFIKATKFLANYKKYKKTYNLPYILGKMYTLSDGTPIVFYEDEIQIGFDSYKYSDFYDYSFLNSLTDTKKNIIINIFTNGTKNIKINIL